MRKHFVTNGLESACNVGHLGLIPGLGRCLENRIATHSSMLAWRIPWTDSPWGRKESDTTERLSLHFCSLHSVSGRKRLVALLLPIVLKGQLSEERI